MNEILKINICFTYHFPKKSGDGVGIEQQALDF